MSSPDRVYGWQHSQLSVARFYGGIKVHGVMYRIDATDPDFPLLRDGVPSREDERQAAKRATDAALAVLAEKAQGPLF